MYELTTPNTFTSSEKILAKAIAAVAAVAIGAGLGAQTTTEQTSTSTPIKLTQNTGECDALAGLLNTVECDSPVLSTDIHP
jgi:hypothetical protein